MGSQASLRRTAADGMRIVLVGDCISSRPLAPLAEHDPAFAAMVTLLRGADATIGNLETSIVDLRDPSLDVAPFGSRNDWSVASLPSVAEDFRELGFDGFGRANNHGADWGVAGLRETGRYLDDVGLIHAGAGETAAAAAAPRYVETSRGRVALISVTTTPATEVTGALDQLGTTPARPGLNVLPVKQVATVPADWMPMLEQLRDTLYWADSRWLYSDTDVRLFNAQMIPGQVQAPELHFEPDLVARAATLRSVRAGKQHADLAVLLVHAHQHDHDPAQVPAFLQQLAHAGIDEGADAVMISGPHRTGPVEIYEGCPIVYGPGNFIWSDIQEPLAHHMWERSTPRMSDIDPRSTTDFDLLHRLNADAFDDPEVFRAVAVELRLEDGQLETRLHPVDLGYAQTLTSSGIPRQPAPEVGEQILERIEKMSEALGARIEHKDGKGIVRAIGGDR